MSDKYVQKKLNDGILTLLFNHPHYNNPFGRELKYAVTGCLYDAESNPEVKGVIITGGVGRSFSVGGDFNEVSNFKGGMEVDKWIDDVVDLYMACLMLTKPSVAAIDNYAIGIGFQLAITCDVRIGSENCALVMPELKHGIACTLGQYMLEKLLGRAAMLEIVYGCEKIPTEKCLEYKLLQKVVPVVDLLAEAQKAANRLISYPQVAFRKTKRLINDSYIKGLRDVVHQTKKAHSETFTAGHAQKFMKTVVDGNHSKTQPVEI